MNSPQTNYTITVWRRLLDNLETDDRTLFGDLSSTQQQPQQSSKGKALEAAAAKFLLGVMLIGWLGRRVVSVLDSGAEGPGSNGDAENAGLENARLENVGPNRRSGKGRTEKRGNIMCMGSEM